MIFGEAGVPILPLGYGFVLKKKSKIFSLYNSFFFFFLTTGACEFRWYLFLA